MKATAHWHVGLLDDHEMGMQPAYLGTSPPPHHENSCLMWGTSRLRGLVMSWHEATEVDSAAVEVTEVGSAALSVRNLRVQCPPSEGKGRTTSPHLPLIQASLTHLPAPGCLGWS